MTKTTEILRELVSFPVLGGQSNLSIVDYIRSYLDSHGVDYYLVENNTEAKVSLHCRIGPAVDGGVILSGHTDVVPVEGQSWETAPFELEERDSRWFARGSADMKGFIACCLACVPEMLQAPLKKPIYLAFSYDEEVGCLGAEDLIEDIKSIYAEKPAYTIVGEPSMLHPVVGHKGICFLTTTIRGAEGHSSRIREEVSAVHEAARLILWLEDKMDTLIAQGHSDDRFTPNHTTLHVGKIHGGLAHNVIADHCYFHWDVRTIPEDDTDAIIDEFIAYSRERENVLRKRFSTASINTEKLHPVVPPLDTPEDQSVVNFIRTLSGVQELETVSYASEAGQFARGGFQTVICGPGDIAQAHRANEFISKEQLEKGEEMIQRLIKTLCGA